MQTITLFDSEGRVSSWLSGDNHLVLIPTLKATRQLYAEGEYSDAYYMVNKRVLKRPVMSCRLVGDTLVELPTPCTIFVNGTAYACDDTAAQIEFDQPGAYTIRVMAWPYLDSEFTYENPA